MTANPKVDRHSIEVEMPAESVYARLVDVSLWSEMFEPTIHACELERRENIQKIQLWATANGDPKTWVSERSLDPKARTIEFKQVVCAPPVSQMKGRWSVHPMTADRCAVVLDHEYRALGDDQDSLAWISQAVDANSTRELADLKHACERTLNSEAAPFSFSDQVEVHANPNRIFSFLERGDEWANRLSHVEDVQFKEYPEGLQFLGMRTRTPDRGTHLTESFRIVEAPALLRYKQITLPKLLTLHTGLWSISPVGEKWRITSTHKVAINISVVPEVLGPDASVEDAQNLVRGNLSNNSRQTLAAAVAWAVSSAQ